MLSQLSHLVAFEPPLMVISPDDLWVAFGLAFPKVYVWGVSSGPRQGSVTSPDAKGRVSALALDPAGKRLAVAYDVSRTLDVYDTATGATARTYSFSTAPTAVAFDPTGGVLAVAADQLYLIDTASLSDPVSLEQAGDEMARYSPAASRAFSGDGQQLVSASNSNLVVWDLVARRPQQIQPYGTFSGWYSAITPAGQFVALLTGRGAQGINLTDIVSADPLRRTFSRSTALPAEWGSLSADGSAAAAITAQGQVEIIDLDQWRVTHFFQAALESPGVKPIVAVGAHGALAATYYHLFQKGPNTVRVWHADSGKLAFDYPVPGQVHGGNKSDSNAVTIVVFSRSAAHLAVITTSAVIVLDAAGRVISQGVLLGSLDNGATLLTAAFSPDESTLAVGDYGGTVWRYDVAAQTWSKAMAGAGMVQCPGVVGGPTAR